MQLSNSQNIQQNPKQRQTLAPAARQGLRLLELDIADLRRELYKELATNPLVEDISSPAEAHTTSEIEEFSEEREREGTNDWPDDGETDELQYSADADALERRQRFFDTLTQSETLEQHLSKQLGAAGLDTQATALAALLLGYLDSDGRFTGSIPDIMMASGATEEEIREALQAILTLDPPGCGASNLQECLLAQLERFEPPFREEMRELISSHLNDLAAHNYSKIEAAMGLSKERLEDDIARLKTLEPHPGRAFAAPDADGQYVRAEIHAVYDNTTNRWIARVDERDLPEIHFSERYLKMLADPNVPEPAKEYIRIKKEAIEQIREAIRKRYETIRTIAQAIFDAQQEYFTRGASALKPLTMTEIAERTGVHHSTVSRTVNEKYTTTPFGVVALRSFFIGGVATVGGEAIARSRIDERLKELVEAEDAAAPLSDERLATLLKEEGFSIARRTVAKYRSQLGIPGATERTKKGFSTT